MRPMFALLLVLGMAAGSVRAETTTEPPTTGGLSAGEFLIVAHEQYSVEWVRVRREKSVWVCETRHVPYFQASSDPLKGIDVAALRHEALSKPKKCEQGVLVVDKRPASPAVIESCLSLKGVRRAFEKIAKRCQSGI